MQRSVRLIMAVTGSLLFAASASAQTIGIADANTGNSFPFGSSAGNRYQQVYAASGFSGLTTVSAISFFRTQFLSSNQLASGTYTLSLSTTSAAVNGLSSTFNSNLGSNNSVFGVFALSGTVGASLDFLGTAFVYNPSAGNLLLDIQVAGGSGGNLFLDAMNGTAAGRFSRAQNYGTETSNWGLVTRFSNPNGPVTTVPEPGTYALVAAGLAGLFAIRRRRTA